MNKKIIAGLMSVAAVGSFWACGSGNINEADAMTDGIVSMQFNNDADPDTTKYRKINENLIAPAKEACKLDANCYAANQVFVDTDDGTLPVASSSSEAGPIIGTSSAYIPKSSSSRAHNTGTMSSSNVDSGSDLPVAESSSAKQQVTGLGTCATTTGATEIDKGSSVVFQFTANPDRKNEIAQMQMSQKVFFAWDYGTGTGTAGTTTSAKSGQATYTTSGPSGASVTVSMGDEEEKIPCDLYVNGAPITCTCTSEATSVDYTSTPDVTWTAACKTDAAFLPMTYEWDGVAGTETYTKTFTAAQDGYVPTLKVGNADNTLTTITTCTSVKTTKGAEYTFEKSDTKIRLPAGESNVVLDLDPNWHNGTEGTCTLRCDGANQAIVITVGTESSKADYSATLSIPVAKTINKSSMVIGLDVSADCQISY